MFFESKVWNNFNDLQFGRSGLRAEGLQRESTERRSSAFWVRFVDNFIEFVYHNKHLWPRSQKKQVIKMYLVVCQQLLLYCLSDICRALRRLLTDEHR